MLRNKRGFTIAEITVGLAMGGLLILALTNVMSYIRIFNRKAVMMSEGRIASSLGERFLWMHFKNADPSFNNLLQGSNALDDGGKLFYTLNPEANAAAVNDTRKVELTFNGRRTFTVVAVNSLDRDVSKGYSPSFFADPTKFYNIAMGTMTGLGQAPFVDMGLFTSYINNQNPLITNADNKFVQVMSPISVRSGTMSINNPPNPVNYFLRYNGGNFIPENFGGAVRFVNAADTNLVLNSFDDFLKTLPSSGGGIPPLVIRSVRYIQYELIQRRQIDHPEPITFLQYSIWDGSKFINPVIVADRIESVTLSRNNITDPLIMAKIKLERLKEAK